MRIALISPLPPYRGGIAAFSDQLQTHLAPNHEILGINFKRLYPGLLFPGRSQMLPDADATTDFRSERLLDSLWPPSWRHAARRLEDFEPDWCIFAYWMPFFLPAYRQLLKAARRFSRTAVLCHNVEEHDAYPGATALKRRFFQAVDRLILLSEVSKEQLNKLGVNTPTTTLFLPIPSGFETQVPEEQARERLGIQPATPVILFFGLVRPYKGLQNLLEAGAILHGQGRDFHLRVAGEFYSGYEDAQSFIQNRGLGDKVILENRFLPDSELSTYFAAADVVCLPYLSATQSGVVPYAYRFNRPVVVTNVGGLPEIVVPGETGYLVPPGDSRALADVLAAQLPAGFRAMRRSVEQAKVQFEWPEFITRLEEALA